MFRRAFFSLCKVSRAHSNGETFNSRGDFYLAIFFQCYKKGKLRVRLWGILSSVVFRCVGASALFLRPFVPFIRLWFCCLFSRFFSHFRSMPMSQNIPKACKMPCMHDVTQTKPRLESGYITLGNVL